jgi:type II secretory pathway component PulC
MSSYPQNLRWLRLASITVLSPLACFLAWQLTYKSLQQRFQAHALTGFPEEDVTQTRDEGEMTALIARAHLFGVPDSSAGARGSAMPAADISVSGIAYSDDSKGSVALLLVDGVDVVASPGTRLASGDVVTGIAPDSVRLAGPGGTREISLDIERVDVAQPSRLAEVISADDPANADGSSMASATGKTMPTLVPDHFKPLRALRGPDAMSRFSRAKPP